MSTLGNVPDFKCNVENVDPYDVRKLGMRQKARQRNRQQRLRVRVGSQVCAQFPYITHISWRTANIAARTRRIEDALMHLNVDSELCLDQVRAGGLFHPRASTAILRNAQDRLIHMCQHGMMTVSPMWLQDARAQTHWHNDEHACSQRVFVNEMAW